MNYEVYSFMLFAKIMPMAWNLISGALQFKYHSTVITYVLKISGKIASKTLSELIMVMNRHMGSNFPSTSLTIGGVGLAVH